MAAARRGDRRALEDLLRLHYDRLHAVCRRMAGNEADGADATQEALIAIVRGLPRFDGTSRFSTWAYRVAVNATLDELRRRGRRAAVDLDSVPPRALASPEGSTAERVDVDAALRRLPVEFRAAVVLRDLCGLDYAEIAEVLAIPPGTVRSRIARGRAALLPMLAPETAPGNPGPTDDRPTQRP
ncbi:MAG TPA: sigma-70 family RNA polymerase sigma factor [Acidimicrobiales bacterium]|nr:sigma-70 family RNA polymerase sigma factor [Acidimicrobiales bacterium]